MLKSRFEKNDLEKSDVIASFTVQGGYGGELVECCPLPLRGGIPRFACSILETGNAPEGSSFADLPRRRIDPEINFTGSHSEPSLVKSQGMPGPELRRPFCSNVRFEGEAECNVYRTRDGLNVMQCIPVI